MIDDEDLRLRFLAEFRLQEQGRAFYSSYRVVLPAVNGDPVRAATLALLTVLLQLSGVDIALMYMVLGRLQLLSLERLSEANVAIYDGVCLVVPGEEELEAYDVATLRQIEYAGPALIGSLYFVGNVCQRVRDVLEKLPVSGT